MQQFVICEDIHHRTGSGRVDHDISNEPKVSVGPRSVHGVSRLDWFRCHCCDGDRIYCLYVDKLWSVGYCCCIFYTFFSLLMMMLMRCVVLKQQNVQSCGGVVARCDHEC